MIFGIGNVVEWTSQSAGKVKTKRGTVDRILGVGGRPDWKNAGANRDHISYIVRVWEGDKTRLYWPRVSQLRLIALVVKP